MSFTPVNNSLLSDVNPFKLKDLIIEYFIAAHCNKKYVIPLFCLYLPAVGRGCPLLVNSTPARTLTFFWASSLSLSNPP